MTHLTFSSPIAARPESPVVRRGVEIKVYGDCRLAQQWGGNEAKQGFETHRTTRVAALDT